ncbi:MAG: hypothetical protein Q8P49_02620 [Candidatus Liptonbacteria bacterium]|nr:hypothetical protein [Candidatus Liptonbacteria bacterium]
MPRRVKFLLFSFVAIPLLLIVASCLDSTYAVNLARTFFNGESAVGFWIKDGFTFKVAVVIAIFCGTWDTLCWFCLFSCFEWIYNQVKKFCGKIEAWIADESKKDFYVGGTLIATVHPVPVYESAIAKAYAVAKRISSFFQPEKIFAALYDKNGREASPRKLAFIYFLLLPLGFVPGCILNGIYCILHYKLNAFVAVPLLLIGNAGKMLASGYIALKIGPWGVVGIVTAFWVAENRRRLWTLTKHLFRFSVARIEQRFSRPKDDDVI